MFLLDTNVVSELRKAGTPKADPNVMAWAITVPSTSLFLSAITILELEFGVLQIERRDTSQASILRKWLDGRVLTTFAGRILPVDVAVARCCARLHVPNQRAERDTMIAATALTHGMTIVTRNTSDFEATGVETLNPWQPRS